ncbi:MAG: hypothetical protein HC805_06180 [Alkalinema sp. RL_2_19]|nr:hypothetical protein [Alkalinema sp. RL_2_19]
MPTDLPALITAGNAVNATGIVDNGNGTVSLVGATTPIQTGDIVLQNVGGTGAPCSDCARTIVSRSVANIKIQDVTIEDTGVIGDQIGLVAAGDILTGNLSATQGVGSGKVFLQSTGGNIQVKTITAGTEGIEIDAAGQFRATDVLPFVGYQTALKNYPLADPDLVPFLVAKTGQTEAAVTAAIAASDNFIDQVSVPVPVSIRTIVGPIKIRYAGANTTPIAVANGVSIQGGDARFEVGPSTTVTTGDRFSPKNLANDFANFRRGSFQFAKK